MDTSLFLKIKKLVEEKTTEKKELLFFLKEKTGINIEEDQIEIKGKKVYLYLNSNQKIIFLQKKGSEYIQEKGFSV